MLKSSRIAMLSIVINMKIMKWYAMWIAYISGRKWIIQVVRPMLTRTIISRPVSVPHKQAYSLSQRESLDSDSETILKIG